MIQVVLTFAALASLSLTAGAQTSVDPSAAIGAWRSSQGASWTAELDTRTGFVRSLYGGHTAATSRLRDDRAAFTRARTLVAATSSMTGVGTATLVDDAAMFLPLSSAGSSDKYTARFRQVVRGIPVVGASVNVLMDLEGRGLSVESAAVPDAELASTTPVREPATAISQALLAFSSIAGEPGEVEGGARLVLDPVSVGGILRAELAWEVDVYGEGTGGVPRGLRLRIADLDLRTTSREELVHTCDVSGTVFTMRTPGPSLPDIATNPPVQTTMAHVQVNSPQGNTVTDINGNFNIPGATAPLLVTVNYNGPFTTPNNQAAPVYSLQSNLTLASGNTIVMNSPAAPFYTAEANSTHWIGALRDWTRAINPNDATADFDATSNINLNQTCNAYFDGGSVNFFRPGGGCVNTAYSSVVAHEMGHWLNVKYGSGNGPDGFGEGNADNFATYLTDQPIIGENFYTNGGFIRTGLNTRQFCGDNNGGCHGGVHNNGEVLMGACWKVRSRLKNTLGASAGSAAADLLFNSWMNAYDDTQIKTIVRTHWLVLDDDDGDINNGTPNYNDLNLGFADQGFPNFPLTAVAISSVTQLANTTNEVGPYVVSATAVANLAPPLSQPQLFWRADNGAFTAVPMNALGGDQYQAAIPGHQSPTKLEYYVTANDSVGTPGYAPTGAPATLFRFVVGEERIYFSDTFEGTFSLWQNGFVNGTNDWQFQTAEGKGGDPVGPKTGLRCWGNDMGLSSSDGLYPANVSNWLQSPPIDLSACPSPRLRVQRWLTVEDATHDRARILVNGQLIWENPAGVDLIDTGWTEVEYDLTAVAAGNPSTRIRFELISDGAVQKGGWNVDDVQIVMLSANGEGCVDPVSYCTGKLTSIGTNPFLTAIGAASASLSTLQIELREATTNKSGVIFHSATGQAATPFQGGTLCVQPPITRDSSFVTDIFGYALIPVPVDANMVGQTWYLQTWFRDPQGSFGIGLSDAVQVKFCP